MSELYFRTENIRNEDLPKYFVRSKVEDEIISVLKTNANVIVEGSRGTGKSFLLKYCAYELETSFAKDKILPVYVTFMGSTLLHTSDPFQFRNWMLARIIREVMKACLKRGIIISNYASTLLNSNTSTLATSVLSDLISVYENSYKDPNKSVDASSIPELNDVVDALNDVCEQNNLKSIYLFFDEAAHIFRPEQQRQFFTLFRDLRSPYVSCKAAVYPGVTHYGNSFELIHDAISKKIERSILDKDYLTVMTEIVLRQADPNLTLQITNNKELFNTLAFSASGNPRILLKSIERIKKITVTEVENLIRTFYRNEIWSEHTLLGEKYKGHKDYIDWGRRFLEEHIIPSLIKKNQDEDGSIRRNTSVYFWIHKDSPVQVKESLRLLTYTGIIKKIDDGVKGTKSKIGSRYEVKYGVILAQISNPSKFSKDIIAGLQLDRFVEYGANSVHYADLMGIDMIIPDEKQLIHTLNQILQKSISELDLTQWQKKKLIEEAGFLTIKQLIDATEYQLTTKLSMVGEIRARQMKNAATAEILEYISG